MMQHPAPKKLLVHIGDITVSFTLLELKFQNLVGSLTDNHQRIGQITTAELAFSRLIRLSTVCKLNAMARMQTFICCSTL